MIATLHITVEPRATSCQRRLGRPPDGAIRVVLRVVQRVRMLPLADLAERSHGGRADPRDLVDLVRLALEA